MSALGELRDAVKLTIQAVTDLETDAACWDDLEDAANEARCRLEGWLETHPPPVLPTHVPHDP
jgi:hypothetical protein